MGYVNMVVTNFCCFSVCGDCYAFITKTAKYIRLVFWVVFWFWLSITVVQAMSRWIFLVGCFDLSDCVSRACLLGWVAWGKVQSHSGYSGTFHWVTG